MLGLLLGTFRGIIDMIVFELTISLRSYLTNSLIIVAKMQVITWVHKFIYLLS